MIVFDDADLDRALDAVVFMIFSLNGERCTSSSRLLVQRSIHDHFVARLTDERGSESRSSARSGHRDRPARASRSTATRSAATSTWREREGATVILGGGDPVDPDSST